MTTTEQRIQRIVDGGFTRREAEALVAAEDARDAQQPATQTVAPKLVKDGAGQYRTGCGRFYVVALHGWYRGTWVLFDKEDRSRREFGSKREAVAALARIA